MANPYYKTYIFAESYSGGAYPGFLRRFGDRIRMTLIFTINDVGTDGTYLAKDYGMYISDFGSIKLDYDFDNYFITPAEYSPVILDKDGTLKGLLYDGVDVDKIDKDFYTKIEILYKGAGSYITEFIGYNVVENMVYEPIRKKHNFAVLPKTNILNETYIHSKHYDPKYFTYGQASTYPNNPLNLTFVQEGDRIKWSWYYLTKGTPGTGEDYGIIEKIFQLLNSNIEVTIVHDWLFYGWTFSQIESYTSPTHTKNNLAITDIILDNNWIGSVFSTGQQPQAQSIGDLLRLLAFEYGCIAGITSQDKAFFKQIYYIDPAPQTMGGTLLRGSRVRKYKYNKIDFCETNTAVYRQDNGQSNRYVKIGYWQGSQEYQMPIGFAPSEILGKVSGENGVTKQLISCAESRSDVLGSYYLSNLRAVYSGSEWYYIYSVKIPDFTIITGSPFASPTEGYYFSLGTTNAELNYQLKGLLYKTPITEFIYSGLEYDFVKGFEEGGNAYSIVSMNKNLHEDKTTIEAIKVASVSIDGGEGDDSGDTILTPLKVVPLYAFGQVVDLTYADFPNVGGATVNSVIATIRGNEILESIEWVILEPFIETEFGQLRIYDGAETLTSSDKIVFTEINVNSVKFDKKYAGNDTIFLEITAGSQTPTQGSGYIIIKKLRWEVT